MTNDRDHLKDESDSAVQSGTTFNVFQPLQATAGSVEDSMDASLPGGKIDGGENDGGKNDSGKDDGGKDDGGKNSGWKNDGGKNEGGKNSGGKDDGGKNEGGKNDDGRNDDLCIEVRVVYSLPNGSRQRGLLFRPVENGVFSGTSSKIGYVQSKVGYDMAD